LIKFLEFQLMQADLVGASHIGKKTSSGSFLLPPSFFLFPFGFWLLASNSNF